MSVPASAVMAGTEGKITLVAKIIQEQINETSGKKKPGYPPRLANTVTDLKQEDTNFKSMDAHAKLAGKGIEAMEQANVDLTARGTPRIRRMKRSREEIGGDPNAEAKRSYVQINGRVPYELRDRFIAQATAQGVTQGKALTEALETYLEKYEP